LAWKYWHILSKRSHGMIFGINKFPNIISGPVHFHCWQLKYSHIKSYSYKGLHFIKGSVSPPTVRFIQLFLHLLSVQVCLGY
jgi:hypothetical protein